MGADRKTRAKGTGSVYQRKRDGKWCGTIDAPGTTASGKRRRITVTEDSKEAVERRLATRRALDEIERRREAADLSLREAAPRVGISEANWRQLTRGSVRQNGKTVQRVARTDQLLGMAAAVGCLNDVAEIVGADPIEVDAARDRVIIEDPGLAEIMSLRHVSTREKLVLMDALERHRAGTESP